MIYRIYLQCSNPGFCCKQYSLLIASSILSEICLPVREDREQRGLDAQTRASQFSKCCFIALLVSSPSPEVAIILHAYKLCLLMTFPRQRSNKFKDILELRSPAPSPALLSYLHTVGSGKMSEERDTGPAMQASRGPGRVSPPTLKPSELSCLVQLWED